MNRHNFFRIVIIGYFLFDKCHECHDYDNYHDYHPVPEGYYWRDYTSEIPEDAYPGGYDVNNKPTYIGQAFLTGIGIIPTTVYRGQTGMNLPCNWKANYSNLGMKILCTSNANFLSWENATGSDLHLTTTGKQLVIGGYEIGKMINVGRVMYQGELIVGKVLVYNKGAANLHFIGGGTEVSVPSYQVLVENFPNKSC